MRLTARVNQYSTIIKWVSVSLIVVGVFLLMQALPIVRGIEALEGWIRSLGIWGPVVLGLIYVVATVLLLPGFLLTVAAGAIFGLVKGTIAVSIGSTVGVAMAFLISRYFAREKVEQRLRRYPKFSAIDKAIGAGGWKIVAMLRLSPAVPFNLQNYAYGLTSIGFWTCVLTSWLFMLPGTFLYVYLGKALGLAAFTAAGAQRERTPAEWALLAVGLVLTIIVTVYVTRLARKMLSQRTEIQDAEHGSPDARRLDEQAASTPQRWPWGVTITALVALLLICTATYARFNPQTIDRMIGGLFGPPRATLTEAYDRNPAGPTFDHSAFDGLLREHVDDNGWVDYAALAKDAKKLDEYISALAGAPFDEMSRNERLALLINAYNAFTLRLILDYWDDGKLQSIMKIPSAKRWDDRRWKVGSHLWSLNQIEHEQIRPKFVEPDVHFALVCAAVGCPTLRNEAYHADRIDKQLDAQARYVHTHDRWFRFDASSNVVHLTKLYDWYGGDFEQVAGGVLEYAARYSPQLKDAIDAGRNPRIKWLEYDWKLNSKQNAR